MSDLLSCVNFTNQVTATDVDADENRRLKYSLLDSMGDKFDIHPTTREIVVNHISERDIDSELTLKVLAEDQGQSSGWTPSCAKQWIVLMNKKTYDIFKQLINKMDDAFKKTF